MIKAIFVRSRNITAYQHEYIMNINKVKSALKRGTVRLNRGISHEQAVAGTHDATIQSYVAEGRAEYVCSYAKREHGVVIVSQDW